MWNFPLKLKSGLSFLSLKNSDLDNILTHPNHLHRHHQEETIKHDSDLRQFHLFAFSPTLLLKSQDLTPDE